MQWADVIKAPSRRTLTEFAVLCLVVFGGLAGWRMWHHDAGTVTMVLAALGLGLGGVGLVSPMALRWVYSGWMIVAFPIGWTISKLMMAATFFLVFTPVALVFRMIGRDVLGRRPHRGASYWAIKSKAATVDEYFRQV